MIFIFLISLIIIGILIRCFIVGVGWVVSDSMNPTLLVNDIILIDKLNKTPNIGDIFAFKYKKKILIKRISNIVGNNIFFLGDNKKNSKDSRSFGYVPKEKLIGKISRILFSFDDNYNIRWNRINKKCQKK